MSYGAVEAPADAPSPAADGPKTADEVPTAIALERACAECCAHPGCGSCCGCLGALCACLWDICRSVPFVAVMGYLLMAIGTDSFWHGMKHVLEKIDGMGVDLSSVEPYIELYVYVMNLDALFILVAAVLLSGFVREWLCQALFVGQLRLPQCDYCCFRCGGSYDLSRLGCCVLCLGSPCLYALIGLAYIGWLLTFVISLVCVAIVCTLGLMKLACAGASEIDDLIAIISQFDSSLSSLSPDNACDYAGDMWSSGVEAFEGIVIMMFAAVNLQVRRALPAGGAARTPLDDPRCCAARAGGARGGSQITIVDKYRQADRERKGLFKRKALLEEVHEIWDEEAAVKEKLSHDHEMERWMGGENSLLKRKFTITTNPDYLAKAKTEIEAVAPERAPDAGAN